MHRRSDPGPELFALAQAQSGVLSVAQAEALGINRHSRRRLLREGRWLRVDGPILAVQPYRPEWLGLAWAGILLGGSTARLAGRAAGFLHGLEETPHPVIDVLARYPARDRHPWRFHRETTGLRSASSRGAPPRTTLDDTVLDLCEDADVDEILTWVTQAVHRDKTSVVRLRRTLRARARHSRRALLNEVLGEVGEGVRSPLERRYRNDVERAHGLPKADRQNRSRRRDQRDAVYEAQRLVVELDGRVGHEGLGRFRDMARDNYATRQGESSLRYGFADVAGSPCAVAWEVGRVLQARGWVGDIRRCPRCQGLPEGWEP